MDMQGSIRLLVDVPSVTIGSLFYRVQPGIENQMENEVETG